MQIKAIVSWFLTFLAFAVLLAMFWEPSPLGYNDAVPYFVLFVYVPSTLIIVFFLTLRTGTYFGGIMMISFGMILLYFFQRIQLGQIDLFHTIPILFCAVFIGLGVISIFQKTKTAAFSHKYKVLPIVGFVIVLPFIMIWYVNNQPPPYYSTDQNPDSKLYRGADDLDEVKLFREKYSEYVLQSDRNNRLALEYTFYAEDHKYDGKNAYLRLTVVFDENGSPNNVVLYCTNGYATESVAKSDIANYLMGKSCLG